jgi:L-lactate dehydrogenase (cytochrome)
VSDYRRLAERRLPRQFFDYIDGGAYEERTLDDNVAAFGRVKLQQRVLRDVSAIDTSVAVFGEKWTIPAALAPVGFTGMFARRGEVQAARAAEGFGVPFTLSTLSICSIEEVRAATKAPFWFQLYIIRDRGYARELMQRAHAAGCTVMALTVDLAVIGARYRDPRNGIGVRLSPWGRAKVAFDLVRHTPWFFDVPIRGRPLQFGNLVNAVKDARGFSDYQNWINKNLDPGMTWKDLDWVRAGWPGKLVIKGILDPADARAAMSAVAPEGIIVSNHGGRQLDSVAATLDALPAIREAVSGKTTILLDGGIRSGLDIFKAMARGADACLIGRAWAFALAANGEAGVAATLRTFKREMEVAMALTGVTKTGDITRDVLA